MATVHFSSAAVNRSGYVSLEINGDDRHPDPFGNGDAIRDTLKTLGFAISKTLGGVLDSAPAVVFCREIAPSFATDERQLELDLEGGA
jgi:sugar phosphate isomerase/epimerase